MQAIVTIRYFTRTAWATLLITALACCLCSQALAEEAEPSDWDVVGWNVVFSLYTKHFDPDPDHNNDQNLFAVEAVFHNDWLAGVAVFDNSFGQDSQFIYVGKTWPILRSELWYVKLIGGLLHGYKEPYEDKIPLNGLGVAPAILPAVGIRYKRVFCELEVAGTAAVTVTAGFSF